MLYWLATILSSVILQLIRLCYHQVDGVTDKCVACGCLDPLKHPDVSWTNGWGVAGQAPPPLRYPDIAQTNGWRVAGWTPSP